MDGTKQYYDVACVIRVEAVDDDAALFWLRDAIQMYPATEFLRWMFVDEVQQQKEESK